MLSSSFISGAEVPYVGAERDVFRTKKVIHEYDFTEDKASFDAAQGGIQPHEFTTQFEKTLPRAKFMRTFVRIEYPLLAATKGARYKVLIKGTLHRNPSAAQEKLLFYV